jgi:hypothetical protein
MVSYFGTNVRQLSSRTGVFIAEIACGELVILDHILLSSYVSITEIRAVGLAAEGSVLLPRIVKKYISDR